MRTRQQAITVLVINLIAGLPAYFIFFMFAYFESTSTTDHLVFLTLITVFAVGCGLLSVPLTARSGGPAGRRATFGVLSSLALNALVLSIGSVVSATHKDEGSVSADFSTQTDAVVALGLLGLAVLFGTLAGRTGRARASDRPAVPVS